MEVLRHENFTPHVGKQFRFPGWHSALQLATVDVRPQDAMPDAVNTPFVLIFHGPAGNVLPEGIYRAEIEDGPALEFYISPIHTVVPGRQEYQAVFN